MDDLARLGKVVRDRRLQLGLKQREAAAAAGVSDTTWLSVESGQRPASEMTLAGVARAMRWTSDSISLILAGANPISTIGTDDAIQDLSERVTAID